MLTQVEEDLIVLRSACEPAAQCAVCGKPIPRGEGITGLYRGRIVRFRGSHCLDQFMRDRTCRDRVAGNATANEWFG